MNKQFLPQIAQFLQKVCFCLQRRSTIYHRSGEQEQRNEKRHQQRTTRKHLRHRNGYVQIQDRWWNRNREGIQGHGSERS